MTQEEFKLLVAGMKSAYTSPNFLPEGDVYCLKVWYKNLKDISYELAEVAVERHICTSKFPPTIAEIRGAVSEVQTSETKSWLEGWSLVRRAISRYGYMRPQEALDWIAEQDALASKIASQLGWQRLCESESPEADRANFRTSYEAILSRELHNAQLAPSVKKTIADLSSKFVLERKENIALPSRAS